MFSLDTHQGILDVLRRRRSHFRTTRTRTSLSSREMQASNHNSHLLAPPSPFHVIWTGRTMPTDAAESAESAANAQPIGKRKRKQKRKLAAARAAKASPKKAKLSVSAEAEVR